MCSPLHLGRRKPPLSIEQLKAAPLLDMKVTNQPWYDWHSWFEAVGSPAQAPLMALYFDSYPLVISAALAGQGICLAWDGLLDDFLNSGALVRLTSAIRGVGARLFRHARHQSRARCSRPRIARWLLDGAAHA